MPLIYLESVGSYLNTEAGVVIPAKENGSPDFHEGTKVHVDDVSNEWFISLNCSDMIEVLNAGCGETYGGARRRLSMDDGTADVHRVKLRNGLHPLDNSRNVKWTEKWK